MFQLASFQVDALLLFGQLALQLVCHTPVVVYPVQIVQVVELAALKLPTAQAVIP